MPRISGIGRRLALTAAITLALVAIPASANAGGAVVFRDHGNTSGEADESNICGWPSHFDGHITYQVTVVETARGTFHQTFHLTDNWTLVIADDPSVPASVRGETWRGRNEITQIVNSDPTGQRVVEITINPFSEGPFHGLVERVVFVTDADGTVRVDNHAFHGDIDCAAFD